MTRRPSPPLILSLAPPESYAPLARITLSRAGYSIVYVPTPLDRFLLEARKQAEARWIAAGEQSDGMIEVRAGLSAGEKVVTSGTVFIDRAARARS